LFKSMIDKVNREVISFLYKGELPTDDSSDIQEAHEVRKKENYKTSKEEIPNSDELAAQNRAAGQNQQRPQVTETIVRERPKINRNDRVTIKNVVTGENKSMKFKQAEPLLTKGDWVLVEE